MLEDLQELFVPEHVQLVIIVVYRLLLLVVLLIVMSALQTDGLSEQDVFVLGNISNFAK